MAVCRECTDVFGQSRRGIGMERAVRLARAREQVDLRVIDHAFPLPLAELWSRADLACAFMCGFPYMLSKHRRGRSRRPSRWRGRCLEGRSTPRVWWCGRILHSVRWKTLLAAGSAIRSRIPIPAITRCGIICCRIGRRAGGNLYRESIGPLITPRRVIEALLAGDIDVGPLDSYALDLMLRHDPDLAAQIRIVATTDTAPIPFLVASRNVPNEMVASLQTALVEFADAAACGDLRDRLCLQGFAPVAIGDYDVMMRWDAEARAAGYAHPG